MRGGNIYRICGATVIVSDYDVFWIEGEDKFLFLQSVIFSSMKELSKEDGFDIDINDIINQLKIIGGCKCSEM